MSWIYLSPHLDDVALSVGGLLWEQSQAGERVAIWTLCAGNPPSGDFSSFAKSLHSRWKTGSQSMPVRRAEDIVACKRLGAEYLHFDLPDCIYRRSPVTGEHLYASVESLWIPVHPHEAVLIAQLAEQLKDKLTPQSALVCPLALGRHVDHRLVRAAAERLEIPLWYYADYPYVLQTEIYSHPETMPSTITPISPGGVRAWQEAVAAHRTQISTFWPNLGEMRNSILAYQQQMGGVRLFSGGRIPALEG